MKNKTFLIGLAAIVGGSTLISGVAGVVYKVKWNQFQKDFASDMKKDNKNIAKPSSWKVISTKHHTVVYAFSIHGKQVMTWQEHYKAFSKYDPDKGIGFIDS